MAYLTIFYQLLIVSGVLAVVTDSENTITGQTNSTESSNPASTPDPETTSRSNSSDNHTIATTETYGIASNSDIPENISSVSNKGLIISTEPQEVPKSQRSDTEASSAAQASSAAAITSTSYIGNSASKVSVTQEPRTFSTPHTSVTVPTAASTLGFGLLTFILISGLILILIILLVYYLCRRKRRYSFDLFHKTAEDADIPLSSPVIPGAFEAIPDKEDNNDVEKVNEDKVNHDKNSVVNLNLPEEINEKQNNCETETNHSPANLDLKNTDNLEDWNFKSAASSFTDIDLMDCVTAE